jgi:hypothetical protein
VVWLAFGIAVLALLLWLARVFAHAPVETVRKVAGRALAGVGVLLLVLLLFSGRGAQALWTLVFLAPVGWRAFNGWRNARAFARRAETGGAGEESAVETATLIMRLDHASGTMSGRVRRGPLAGRELAELTLPEMLALMEECRLADPDSVPLLEAWLDRVVPEWREHAEPSAPPPSPSGPMSRAEALAVLGLEEGAAEPAIRAAHRRLMQAAHPDRGGSDWLAARINQARDVLLG